LIAAVGKTLAARLLAGMLTRVDKLAQPVPANIGNPKFTCSYPAREDVGSQAHAQREHRQTGLHVRGKGRITLECEARHMTVTWGITAGCVQRDSRSSAIVGKSLRRACRLCDSMGTLQVKNK